ncbi:hypothetical protein D1Y85_00780 [Paraburkholderia dinghuensis]|uniref:Uncharacterized protein n=1 Tax=Paraburkholderia dinghuensis TaxID=2305225 RepID=A0A3N6NKN7_9BURK|nr:hypothetical protein D1Y85_00780 [Paraburkholderia dinghuensis]
MKESLGSCKEGTGEVPATVAILRRSTSRAEVTRIVNERLASGHPHENVPHGCRTWRLAASAEQRQK